MRALVARLTFVARCEVRTLAGTLRNMPVTPSPPAPSTSPDDAHAAAAAQLVREAEELHAQAHAKVVSAAGHIAALRAAEWSYRRIDQATGVAPSTAVGWLDQFVTGDGPYTEIGRDRPERES